MTEEQIIAILHSFRVQKHYRGSSDAKVLRYAVFRGHEAVSEPLPHREAHDAKDRLIAQAIMGLGS